MPREESTDVLARLSADDVRWAIRICNIVIALIAAAVLATMVL